MYLSQQIEHVFKLIGLSKDERNINQLITDIAENHKERDYHHLFLMLKDREIFIPIKNTSRPNSSESNNNSETELLDQNYSYRVLGENDQTLIPAALDSSCDILKHGYLKMSWIKFITMIYNKADVDGATLEGESSWVKLGGERINTILKQYKIY